MRKLFLFIAFSCIGTALFALPGVSSYIPDASGEYVYYRDYSFKRESYIGFLYYDDGTYAARFYAPLDSEKQLPVQEVGILFSVDSSADHVEMTGERFTTAITPDDTDIVNYLHDMMYELTARRSKVENVTPETVAESKTFLDRGLAVNDDFMQFGGSVTILYDYLVPIFNVRKIISSEGKDLLRIVTAGLLVSSADSSFNDFSGLIEPLLDANEGEKISQKSEKQTYILNRPNAVQSVTLDSLWQPSASNVWMFGNNALCSMNIISLPDSEKQKFLDVLQRKLLLGTEESYSVWDRLAVSVSDSKISVAGYYYQNKTGAVTKDFKILTKLNDSEYGYINMTVFDSCYRKNYAYFDEILNSYTVSK